MPGLVRASAIAQQTLVGVEKQDDLFGPAQSFAAARDALVASKLRGHVFEAIRRDAPGLLNGYTTLFRLGCDPSHLAPTIENELSESSAEAVKAAKAPWLSDRTRDRLINWHERAMAGGEPRGWGKRYSDLTLWLASIRLCGFSSFLADGPIPLVVVLQELEGLAGASILDVAEKSLATLRCHMSGETPRMISETTGMSSARVRQIIGRQLIKPAARG